MLLKKHSEQIFQRLVLQNLYLSHPLGAASVHEAIYCLIMMKNNFITGSANINEMDEDAKKFPIVSKTETGITLNTVMSNSFGFWWN